MKLLAQGVGLLALLIGLGCDRAAPAQDVKKDAKPEEKKAPKTDEPKTEAGPERKADVKAKDVQNAKPETQDAPRGWFVVEGQGTFGAYDICFSDEKNGWAVGYDGKVIKTEDGGQTSKSVLIGTKRGLRAVHADAKQVWIAGQDSDKNGASIFYSTDDGDSWATQFNTDEKFPGRTGTRQDRLESLCFLDATHGFAAGGLGDNTSVILKTTDGQTWKVVYHEQAVKPIDHLNCIRFADEKRGFAVGKGGVVLITSDAGETWKPQTSGTTEELFKIACWDAQNAVAVGGKATVVKTKDGGKTWEKSQLKGTFEALTALAIVKDRIWVGGTNGVLMRSTDRGTSWVPQDKQRKFAPLTIQCILMMDENHGVLACANDSTAIGRLGATVDGGED